MACVAAVSAGNRYTSIAGFLTHLFFFFLPGSWNALIYYFNTVSCLLCHSKIFYSFSGSIMLCTKRRVSSISQGEDVGTRDHDLDSSARDREEPVGNKNVAGGGISLPVHRSAWWVSTDNSVIPNCKPASIGKTPRPIYLNKWVHTTKLSCNNPHWRSARVSLETYSWGLGIGLVLVSLVFN